MSPRVSDIKYRRKYSQSTDDVYNDGPQPIKYTYDVYGNVSHKSSKFLDIDYKYGAVNNKLALNEISYVSGEPGNLTFMHLGYNVEFKDSIQYDDNGRLKSVDRRVSQKPIDYETGYFTDEQKQQYFYDNVGRLTRVAYTKNGLTKNCSIGYRSDGRMSYAYIGGESVDFQYDSSGRMIQAGDCKYSYDNYGNRTKRISATGGTTEYTYTRGGQLQQAGNARYYYNKDGVRNKKVVAGEETSIYTDGNKVLCIVNPAKKYEISFFYDLAGLYNLRYNYDFYDYFLDSQGNVAMILDGDGKTVARYEYDVFGNHTVYNGDNEVDTDPTSIGNVNPFRWKSFYYDTETGLYYANGSYYDPATASYVDASPIESVVENAFATRSLDRNGLICNNVLELAGNPYNVYTTQELSTDTDYAPKYSWLTNAKIKIAKWLRIFNNTHWLVKYTVGFLCLVFAVYMTIQSGGTAVAIFVELAIGIGVGVATWAISSLVRHQGLTLNALRNVVVDAFLFTSVFIFISSSINAIKYASRMSPITKAELNNEYILANKGTTGRTEARNLNEQLAMQQTMSNPCDGTIVNDVKMRDPRWSMKEGWIKMQQHYVFYDESKTTIHYVINERLRMVDDFKFIK